MIKIKKGLATLLASGTCLTLSGCDDVSFDEIKKLIEGIDNINIEIYVDGEVKNSDVTTTSTTVSEDTTYTTVTSEGTTYPTTSYTAFTSANVITSDTTVYTSNTTNTTTTTTTTTLPTIETTLLTTTSTEKVSYNADDLGMDGMTFNAGICDVVQDDIFNCFISDELDTLYKVAVKYCPVGMRVSEFLEVIKKENNKTDDIVHKGKPILVPANVIYSSNGNNAESACYYGYTSIDEINQLNNLNIKNYDELKKIQSRLIIKALPKGTTFYKINDNLNAYLYAGSLVSGSEFVPCVDVFNDNHAFSGMVINNTGLYRNSFAYINVFNDGSCEYIYLGENIGDIYTENGFPVFRVRNEAEILCYSVMTGYPASAFETNVTTMCLDLYDVYKDNDGNVCFTINGVDLTKYGYTLANDLKNKYIRLPEDVIIEDTKTKKLSRN